VCAVLTAHFKKNVLGRGGVGWYVTLKPNVWSTTLAPDSSVAVEVDVLRAQQGYSQTVCSPNCRARELQMGV